MAVQVLNKKKKRKINWRRTLFICGMLAIPIIQFAIFFIYVNIDSVVMTFQYTNGEGQLVWGVNNYKKFFMEMFGEGYTVLPNAFGNSLLFGLNDVVLVIISLVLSYFFFKKIRGRQFFRIIFFLPSIISIVIYSAAYYMMFKPEVGPINKLFTMFGGSEPQWFVEDWLGKFLVMFYCLWVGTGYNILIFGGAMANLNSEVIEYAKLDGVGMFRELFQIILPMIWPTISVAFLGSVTTIFTLFIQVQLISGGAINAPKTIAFILNNAITSNPQYAATIGICFTIVATPLILVVRKVIDIIGKKFGF